GRLLFEFRGFAAHGAEVEDGFDAGQRGGELFEFGGDVHVGRGYASRSGRLGHRGGEGLGGVEPVGVGDDGGDLVPVGVPVDADADPATVPDVGRAEELLGVFGDELLLGAGDGRAPERQVVDA